MAMQQSTLQVIYDQYTILNLYSRDSDRGICHQVATDLMPERGHEGRCFIATIGPEAEIPMYRAFLKFAWGVSQEKKIEAEYEIYKHLSHLQGTAVPRCYGCFTGSTNSQMDGTPVKFKVTCLVLEYCCEDISRSLSTEEFNRQIMTCICKIHAAGVEHRNLNYHDPHHIVKYGMSPRIVDFSQARLHKCPGATPASRNGQLMGSGATCTELVQLELNYGLQSGKKIVPPQPYLAQYVRGR